MLSTDLNIGFIGIGKMGKALALALASHDYRVTACYTRSHTSTAEFNYLLPRCVITNTPQEVFDQTNLVFITIPDDFIQSYVQDLVVNENQAIVHCSGSLPRSILSNANHQGRFTGMFHPYQTLAGIDSSEAAAERLSGITFAIDAEGWLLDQLVDFGESLDSRTIHVPSSDLGIYHSSAVLTCGFLVTLLHCAISLWEEMGHNKDDAMKAILPLAKSTLSNVENSGVLPSMTGPIYRGDIVTIEKHISSLVARTPEIVDVYTSLFQASLPIAQQLGADSSTISAFETLIKDTFERKSKCAG